MPQFRGKKLLRSTIDLTFCRNKVSYTKLHNSCNFQKLALYSVFYFILNIPYFLNLLNGKVKNTYIDDVCKTQIFYNLGLKKASKKALVLQIYLFSPQGLRNRVECHGNQDVIFKPNLIRTDLNFILPHVS